MWEMKNGEAWLIIGPNGSGKDKFLQTLAREKDAILVSLERAAKLIEEERELDESEYMDRIDEGRTGRRFLCEVLGGPDAKHRNTPLPPIAERLETLPEVKLCGVEKILDRGLKFMSTGEIRRILLCQSLLSKNQLLILSDPFAGLDAFSRKILLEFFQTIVGRQSRATISTEGGTTDNSNATTNPTTKSIILSMERYTEIPETITNVLEFEKGEISFSGTKAEYEKLLAERSAATADEDARKKRELEELFAEIKNENVPNSATSRATGDFNATTKSFGDESAPLIKMQNVNVGWGDHKVIRDFNWTVEKNEHWLIRGPNGSGKTTILELITGDNMQVFCNDVELFGRRRGTGESIWDIKSNLGIVSYRLHVEYRMVGGTDLEGVIISGFRDSIGLYEQKTDVEKAIAKRWLRLAGFSGRENETFGSLSYGEQRAILIIRAAVKHPKILILDEPCHGLDEENREKILHLLETISKTGTTTFLHVTHDPTEALDCEKHILELHPDTDPMYEIIQN